MLAPGPLGDGPADALLQLAVVADPLGRRVREVRLNDLIDPEAVPLGEPLGLVLESDLPVVAQLRSVDTRRDGLAVTAIPGLPG